jgi:glycosyltransferase involved in cell wall biosynthesis
MNVCVLAWAFYDYDPRIRREAEVLADRGDSVDVLCLRWKGDSRNNTVNGVNVYRIIHRTLEEKGALDYLASILKFFVLSSFWVTKLHLRKRYDVIHVHSVPDFEVLAALVPKLLGAKVILDIHDIVPEFYAQKFSVNQNSLIVKILRLIEKLSIKFSNHVIISNDLWREKLIKRSAHKDKCTALLNLPDPKIFKRTNPVKYSGFTLIYHGVLARHQGLDIAIKAINLIKADIPLLKLIIYGKGPDQQELVDLTKEMHLEDAVSFNETVPVDLIPDIISRAHIGVVPKRGGGFAGEAFSTKILEFMAVGVPVIAAKNKIEEYYFNDSQIMFFEPGNVEDLAKCILELYRDPSKRQDLIENADQLLSRFNWQVHKNTFFGILDNLVKKKVKNEQ